MTLKLIKIMLFLLFSLPSSYEHFVATLFDGNDTISIADVKAFLQSRELKKKVFREEGEGQVESLFVREWIKEKKIK